MKSPPVSVGSLRAIRSRIRLRWGTLGSTMLATVQLLETAAAREALRGQIARLERELAQALASSYPPIAVARPIGHGGPRLLGLEELERTRDALAARVSDAHRLLAEQRDRQAHARARLAEMYARPAEHKGARISNAE